MASFNKHVDKLIINLFKICNAIVFIKILFIVIKIKFYHTQKNEGLNYYE